MASCELEILGVRVHMLTVEQLLALVARHATEGGKTVIAHVNVHGLNIACELPWYRVFLNQADVVFCDGFGVLLGARILGYRTRAEHRMTCPDWIESLGHTCAEYNLSLFLLGGRPGVAEAAAAKLEAAAPGLRVAAHHGYFEKTGTANDAVVARINEFRPHVLYVGMGMPLQEQWIAANKERVDARVFLPLGACLDFYAGYVRRAPLWMTDHGLEWLGRLFIERRRLWRRYVVGNPKFVWRVIRQRLGLLRLR